MEGEIEYVALPKDWYTIPSYTSVIKAGERYVRFPVRVDTEKIDTDARYLIPLKIVDSSPYPVNEQADTVLLVKVKMIDRKNYYMRTIVTESDCKFSKFNITQRMNFYPIRQGIIDKNPRIDQNQGY